MGQRVILGLGNGNYMHQQNGRSINVGDPVTLKQLDQAHIRYWMEKTGSRKEAAPILGLNPGSLSRKTAKEHIQSTKNANHEPDPNQPPAGPEQADSDSDKDDAAGSTDD